MKSLLKIFLFSTTITFISTAQNPGLKEVTSIIEMVEGKVTNKQAELIIENLFKEKVLNNTGRDEFKKFVTTRQMPKLIETKEGEEPNSRAAALKGFLPMLYGKDSLNITKSTILALLAYAELANFDDKTGSKDKISKAQFVDIFGEKWKFKPVISGDAKNPFSMAIDMKTNKGQYASLIESMNKAGLLSPLVLKDMTALLEQDKLNYLKYFGVIVTGAIRSIYYDSYMATSSLQKSQIEKLKNKGMLTAEVSKALSESIKDYQLLSKTQVLSMNKNAAKLSKTDFQLLSKENVLKKMFEKVSQLVPELKVTDLKIKTTSAELPSRLTDNPIASAFVGQLSQYIDFQQINVSANLNGKTYYKELKGVSLNEDLIEDQEMVKPIMNLLNSMWLSNQDVAIVNDFLVDAGSTKRMYVVGDELSLFPKADFNNKVMFLADSSQLNVMKDAYLTLKVSANPYDYEGQNSLSGLYSSVYENLFNSKIIKQINKTEVENLILKARANGKGDAVKQALVEQLLTKDGYQFFGNNLVVNNVLTPNFDDALKEIATKSGGAFKYKSSTSNFTELSSDAATAQTYRFSIVTEAASVEDSVVMEEQTSEQAEMQKLFGGSRIDDISKSIWANITTVSEGKVPYNFGTGKDTKIVFISNEHANAINENVTYYFSGFEKPEVETASDEADYSNSSPEQIIEKMHQELVTLGYIDDVGEKAYQDLLAKKKKQNEEQGLDEEPRLDSFYQLIPFMKNSYSFNYKENSKDGGEQFLKNFYEKVRSKFFPTKTFTKLEVLKEAENGEEGMPSIFKVKYEIDGKKYLDKFADIDQLIADQESIEEGGYSPFNEFYITETTFNNYLTDIDADFRILSSNDGEKLSLIAANQEVVGVFDDNSFTIGTYKSVEDVIKELIAKEVIGKLSPEKIEEYVLEYRSNNIYIDQAGLIGLINPNFTSGLDLSYTEGEYFLPTIFGRLSDNLIKITDFKTNYVEASQKADTELNKEEGVKKLPFIEVNIDFKVGAKIFKKKYKTLVENAYFDSSFQAEYIKDIVQFLNTSLPAGRTDKKFYFSEYGNVYFLSEKQKGYLVEMVDNTIQN